MNIFRYIKRLFKPEWHFFMLKNGEDVELRFYKNGKRVTEREVMNYKGADKVINEYKQKLDEQLKTKQNK